MNHTCTHDRCLQNAGGYNDQHRDLCYAHAKQALGLMAPAPDKITTRLRTPTAAQAS